MFRAKQRSAQELFQENRVVKLKPVQFRAGQRLLSLQKRNISRQLNNKTHLVAIRASLAPTNWGQRNRYQNCRGSRTPTWPVQFSSTRPDRYGTRREPKPDEGRTPSGFAFVRQLGHRAPETPQWRLGMPHGITRLTNSSVVVSVWRLRTSFSHAASQTAIWFISTLTRSSCHRRAWSIQRTVIPRQPQDVNVWSLHR